MNSKTDIIISIIFSAAVLLCSGCMSVNNHFSSDEWKIVRELYNISDSISDESYWKQLRKDHDEYSELSDEEFWNVFILEKQVPAYYSHKVSSANSVASSIRGACDAYFTRYKLNNQVCVITVIDKNWSCSDALYQEVTDYLKKIFPEIKNASIAISNYSGKCKAAAYIPDYTQSIVQGEDYPVIRYNGEFADGFEWDGKTEGVNSKGYIVGTSPKVPLGTSPEIPVATTTQYNENNYWSS